MEDIMSNQSLSRKVNPVYIIAVLFGIYHIIMSVLALIPVIFVMLSGGWKDFLVYIMEESYPNAFSSIFLAGCYDLNGTISVVCWLIEGLFLVLSKNVKHWKRLFIMGIILLFNLIKDYVLACFVVVSDVASISSKTLIWCVLAIAYGVYTYFQHKKV